MQHQQTTPEIARQINAAVLQLARPAVKEYQQALDLRDKARQNTEKAA